VGVSSLFMTITTTLLFVLSKVCFTRAVIIKKELQSLRISTHARDNGRPFFLNTPRLPCDDQIDWVAPFESQQLSGLLTLSLIPLRLVKSGKCWGSRPVKIISCGLFSPTRMYNRPENGMNKESGCVILGTLVCLWNITECQSLPIRSSE